MKNSDIERMFEAIAVHGRDLTEWEDDFVKSVERQYSQRGSLTPKQAEILERIYSERTPTGTSFGIDHRPAIDLPSERLKNRSRRYD